MGYGNPINYNFDEITGKKEETRKTA